MNFSKQAADLPLSPEEAYQASQLFGRSLFSAMQLAKEQELLRRERIKKMYDTDDEKTLKIPIPKSLLPSKVAETQHSVIERPDGSLEYVKTPDHRTDRLLNRAARNAASNIGTIAGGFSAGLPGALAGRMLGSVVDADAPYTDTELTGSTDNLDGTREHLFGAKKGKGLSSHLKRNLGKYLGTAGGAVLGASAADKSKLLRMLLPLAGYGLGSSADQLKKERVLSDMLRDPEKQKDMITEVLFKDKKKHEKTANEDVGGFAGALQHVSRHPLRMILGGQEGFRDAREQFYYQEKAKAQKELMDVQQEYIDLLSRIKTGADETNTPCVDAFCNGIAHYTLFGKTASFKDVDMADDSVSRLAGELLSAAKRPFRPVTDLATSGLLNTAVGTAYLTQLLKKKMREEPEEYTKQHLPTRVELQPY